MLAVSDVTATPEEERPAADATAAEPDDRGDADDDDEDAPTQVPEEADSDATQPGDPLDDLQQDAADTAGGAEPQPPPDGARVAEAADEPVGPEGASPAAPADIDAGGGGTVSPFSVAKATATGRRGGSAAAQRAQQRRVPTDPYAFPETQDMVNPQPAPWKRKKHGAKAEKSTPSASLLAVPESSYAPATSHERTQSAPGDDAAPAAVAMEGAAEAAAAALEHADSPDQQSQHVPKASARRGAATAREAAAVSNNATYHCMHLVDLVMMILSLFCPERSLNAVVCVLAKTCLQPRPDSHWYMPCAG